MPIKLARRNRRKELEELAKRLLYDDVTVYAPRVGIYPIYEIEVKRNKMYLVYKFKGEDTAWDEAREFVKELGRRGIKAKIDYDASERDKVFVVVSVPLDEELKVYEKRTIFWEPPFYTFY